MKVKTRSNVRGQVLVAILLVFAVAGCSGLGGATTATSPAAAATSTSELPAIAAATSQPSAAEASAGVAAALATPAPSLTGSFQDAIRQVAEQVKPAVVQVTNEQAGFGGFGSSSAIPVGVGSGIIYDSQGHILTNNHVVDGATTIVVSLSDGRTFTAKLLGGDARTDLAVIQISGSNLPVAPLGDSTQMRVGDWVVAIGNALALSGGPTVTAGVVSAMDRSVQEPATSQAAGPFLFGLIQTDAPINPGNSGGALVNLDGQVIGINTLGGGTTSAGTQTYGIGFAISIATAKPIADQLVATGKVVHPYVGVSYVPLNPALSAQNGISVPYGAYITSVVPGSPAAQAGLQSGDVITAIDGTPIQNDSDLAQILSNDKPGDTVTMTVLRGSQTLKIDVTLGQTAS
jgi:S1-C subfamily serine protease